MGSALGGLCKEPRGQNSRQHGRVGTKGNSLRCRKYYKYYALVAKVSPQWGLSIDTKAIGPYVAHGLFARQVLLTYAQAPVVVLGGWRFLMSEAPL